MDKVYKNLYKGIYSINLDRLFECRCKIDDMETSLAITKFPIEESYAKKVLKIAPKAINTLLFKTRAVKRNEIIKLKRTCKNELKNYHIANEIYALFENPDIYTEVIPFRKRKGIKQIKYVYGANEKALIVEDKMRTCLHTGEFNRILTFIYKDGEKEKLIGEYKLSKIKLFNKIAYHSFGDIDLVKFLYNVYTKDNRRVKLNV